MRLRALPLIVALLLLVGCSTSPTSPAPVGRLAEAPVELDHYRVQMGDSLYAIAWAYELDPQALARWNHLHSTDALKPGQVLVLSGKAIGVKKPVQSVAKKVRVAKRKPSAPYKAKGPIRWHWPVKKGKVRLADRPYRGLLFTHPTDLRVRAAASGRVVYSGQGIRGYGHLLLLEHGSGVLSAYGFNESVSVKVGDNVVQGQVIARMGVGPRPGHWLYFEVRKLGRVMNASRLLMQMKG